MVTICGVRMTVEAADCVAETGADVLGDVEALRSGAHTSESLLAHCLDGVEAADASRREGWREYVHAVELAAATSRTRKMIRVLARKRDGGQWGDVDFRARALESGVRTAARKLGLNGQILNCERVGSHQYAVNVDGTMMMVIATDVPR